MRAVALCLLGLLAVASARDLRQAAETSCKTEANAVLDLRGSGKGVASAQSFCEAEAQAEAEIKEIISEYMVKVFEGERKGQCTEAKATEAAEAIAEAIASAYSSVTTKVEITGEGEACADGFAAGDAMAVSLVDIVLRLSVTFIDDFCECPDKGYGEQVTKAFKDKDNNATGEAKGSAIALAIATAWSAASSEACTTGGFDKNFEEAYVKSITPAIAELWATVVVELCSNFDDVDKAALDDYEKRTSESFAEVAGEIDVDGTTIVKATEGGAASGTAEEIVPCTGDKKSCCKSIFIDRDVCDCGAGCKLVSFSPIARGDTIWKDDTTGSLCFC